MVLLICITVFSFLCAFWNLTIAILGLFPQLRETAVGTLGKICMQRNVQVKHRVIPILTNYGYVYTVKGKNYYFKGFQEKHKRNLRPKIVLEYVKWFPRHAYQNRFTGSYEWIVGICMLIFSMLFLWLTVNVQAA